MQKKFEYFPNPSEYEDNQKYINDVIIKLQQISTLGKTLQFRENKQSPGMNTIVFGEVGNGKSTFLTHMCNIYCKMRGFQFNLEQDTFRYGKSVTSLTQDVSAKKKGDLILIDTPGYNDPQKQLSDSVIGMKIKNFLWGLIYQEGISSITQCVMIDKGGRIKDTAIGYMSKFLLSLTTVCPNFDVENGPRVNVVFTNLSRYEKQDDWDPLAGGQIAQKNGQENKPVDISSYEINYKKGLVEQVYLDLGKKVDKKFIERRVERVLPPENFYAFKLEKGLNYDMEAQQIRLLLHDNFNHGKWAISNDTFFEPVQLNYDMRDKVKKNLENMIDISIQVLQNANNIYQGYSDDKKSSRKINSWINNFQHIKKEFTKMSDKTPWSLSKTPLCVTDEAQDTIEYLNSISGDIAQQEIKRYNESKSQEFEQYKKKQQNELIKTRRTLEELQKFRLQEKQQFQKQIQDQKHKYSQLLVLIQQQRDMLNQRHQQFIDMIKNIQNSENK